MEECVGSATNTSWSSTSAQMSRLHPLRLSFARKTPGDTDYKPRNKGPKVVVADSEERGVLACKKEEETSTGKAKDGRAPWMHLYC